jgi:hypothetical protein
MAKYKDYDYSQRKFITAYFDKQILPGIFRYNLHYVIGNEIDLPIFDTLYQSHFMKRRAK